MTTKRTKLYRNKSEENYMKTKQIMSIKYLINKEQYSKALNEVENYLEKYTNDSYGLFQLGCIYHLIGETEAAKEQFQYIVDSNLESVHSALYKLAIIEREEGNIEKAERLFIDNIESSPYPETYSVIELSNIQLLKGQPAKGLEYLYKYGDMKEDDIKIQEVIFQYALGSPAMAYENLMSHDISYSAQDSTMSRYYHTKSTLECALEYFDKAEESILKCYNYATSRIMDKNNADYANVCYRKGDYDKARELCEKVINSSEDDYKERAYNILGSMYRNMGDYEKAKKYYMLSEKYQKFPAYRGYYYLGELCTLKGDYNEAKKWYMNVVKNSKNKEMVNSAYIRLGFICMRLNDMVWAERNYYNVDNNVIAADDVTDYAVLKAYMLRYRNISVSGGYYSCLQLYNYDYDRLIEHIDRQHCDDGKVSTFNENIDLNELVLYTTEQLTEENLRTNYTVDVYAINYDNVGYANGEVINTYEVVTFPGSKKIITMYPRKYHRYESNLKKKEKEKIKKYRENDK